METWVTNQNRDPAIQLLNADDLYMYIYSKRAELVKAKLTAARLSSVSLADFFARKDLADFLLEALLDFSRRRFRVFCE
jgi:hypothetical protein